MYVCLCKAVRESQVREVVRAGASTPGELITALGLDQRGCCGRCARDPDRLWALGAREQPLASPSRRELTGSPT
jgi:bacterioferritin-associated ferredoxin